MHNDRHADPRNTIDRGCRIIRHIDTAVGPAALIDIAAEGRTPSGIVQALAAMERHPEIDPALIT